MVDVRLALIGCGAAARSYYLPVFQGLPNVARGLYLVDKDIGRARELAGMLGSSNYAERHEEILGEVQGVIIAAPHFLHYPIALDCLKRRLHVLCEKPLADAASHAVELIDEAEKQGVTLSVNNTWRMFPAFREICRLVSEGCLGKLREINIIEGQKFDWESYTNFYVNPQLSAKGALLDVGAHFLDLVCWWAGGKPQLVSCEDDSFGGPESVVRIKARKGDCGIELKLNRLVDVDSSIAVAGERGRIECHATDWKLFTYTPKGGRPETRRIATPIRMYWEFVEQLVRNFVNVVSRKEAPLVPVRDVLASILFLEECYHRRSRLPMPWYEKLESLLDG